MDPRRSKKTSKVPLAPGAKRLGGASDNESLPSAPSPGFPSVSPEGDAKRRKSSAPESRRVVVASETPRVAILKPILKRGEERPRLTPSNVLLRGRAEVEGREKDSEPRRKHGKLKGDKAEKAEKPKRAKHPTEEAPRKPKVEKVKTQGSKRKKEKEVDDKGLEGEGQKKKDKKEKKREKERKEKKEKKEKEQEPEEASTEVRAPSPKSQNGKLKKEKKTEKARNKTEKEKEKARPKQKPQAEAERIDKQSKAKKDSKRHKEKKSKPEPERSRSEDPPRQTADEPETRRKLRHREEPPSERDRRRRKERPRSESSRPRRRQRILPPDAWQVWPAGSYHPWSSQLAGAPLVWPMSMGEMSQAWMGNMPPQAQDDSDSESSEDLEGRELEAPQEEQEEEQDEQEEEEEEELEKPVVVKTVAPEIVDDDGSATTRTSEGEESETESQDEDAEIGEAPVARRPIIELGDIDMPKVKWYPPGPERPRDPLHHSMQRWPGPKVGWMALYQLDIDPAVQMKSSVQQIREGDGKGLVDPDAPIQATAEANPSEAPVNGVEGPAAPLLIPRWGNTRGWSSPPEVVLEDTRWEKRKLSSAVLRSRRTGRTAAGGGHGANPQDPPESQPSQSEGSTFLIFLGAVARSVRMVQWRPPPALVLPDDLKVDPAKYRGVERNLRIKRRPAKPKKKAAVKSAPSAPGAKASDDNSEYKAKLRALMQQLQDGSATADAVSTFWGGLSPANRVLFSSEFPQFMHLVSDAPLPAMARSQRPMETPMMPPSLMHLPVPPPPKTTPPPMATPVPMAIGVPGVLAAPVAPVAWPKAVPSPQLAPEIIKQQEAAWANRLTFHDGILRADMSSLQLGDAGLSRWCQWAPNLLKTLGSAGGAPLSNADLNFSGNAIEDAGLRHLLDLLRSCDVHVRSLNLDANRLTEASLVTISDLIAESRMAVSAVHMKNNRVQGSYGLMHLTRAIKNNDKYPMSDKNRYTPLMLHLAGNMIERPMQVTQMVKEALDNKFPSLSEERQYWESKHQCPPLQLPCFDKQETSMFQ